MTSLLYKITGNQNAYKASTQNVEIYNVRYVKIQSTEAIDFCIRIELCGIGKYTYTSKQGGKWGQLAPCPLPGGQGGRKCPFRQNKNILTDIFYKYLMYDEQM